MLRAVYRFLSVLNIETAFAFDFSSLAGPRPRSGETGSGVRDREREADMQFDLGTVTVLKTVTGQPASQRRFRLTDNARVYNGILLKILQNILQGMCVSAV